MTQFFVRHPVTTWMIFAVFVLLGIYALPKLQVEAIPEINLPTLTVQTYWNGASPRAVQRSITIPIHSYPTLFQENYLQITFYHLHFLPWF